ncbi:uncharacterized protein LOC125945500 [Dermacentor silvarum]|uniref:uncharacterized protein LOC125945500 n=1 Tax=Dermacentor silvarum TaxID=543639 RepID=UPI0021019A80|nr:uncharacterized protein LOC125945500 [Dermacentor silvarum]
MTGDQHSHLWSIKSVGISKACIFGEQLEVGTMTSLLLVSVLAISVACVTSYQQNVLWGRGLSGSPLGFGGGAYGNQGSLDYGSSHAFGGGLGGLSVYGNGEGGNGDSFGFGGPYSSNSHRRYRHAQGGTGVLGSDFTGSWFGQQQQQQQRQFDW